MFTLQRKIQKSLERQLLLGSQPGSQQASQAASQSGQPVSWPTASRLFSQLAHSQPGSQSVGQHSGQPAASQPASRPAGQLAASQGQPAASQPARRTAGQPAASQQPVSQQDQQALINLPRWFASCRRGGGECNSQGMDADFISFLHFCMENPTFSAFSAFWGCLAGVGWWWGSVSSHLGSLPKCRKCRKCWFYNEKMQKSCQKMQKILKMFVLQWKIYRKVQNPYENQWKSIVSTYFH